MIEQYFVVRNKCEDRFTNFRISTKHVYNSYDIKLLIVCHKPQQILISNHTTAIVAHIWPIRAIYGYMKNITRTFTALAALPLSNHVMATAANV